RMKMTTLIQRVLKFKLEIQGGLPSSSYESIDAIARSAVAAKPNLAKHVGPEGVVTLLFSDIENSTPLTQQMGDEGWLEILNAHNELIRTEVTRGGGQVVKTQGDGFMVAFSSARSALRSAIAIQKEMQERDLRAGDVPIRVRIGLHTGELVRVEGDFFGRHVNLASRVASQAKGGQILVSSLTRELVAGSPDFVFSDPWEVDLKGVSETQRLVELKW
ncbi:MAG: adenylate/guanylate cyclase domain-containing protein, partial [Actinomycetota bacterium]